MFEKRTEKKIKIRCFIKNKNGAEKRAKTDGENGNDTVAKHNLQLYTAHAKIYARTHL